MIKSSFILKSGHLNVKPLSLLASSSLVAGTHAMAAPAEGQGFLPPCFFRMKFSLHTGPTAPLMLGIVPHGALTCARTL